MVVVCETYKFEDRVNLDQISNNQQGAAHKFYQNYLKRQCPNNANLEELIQKKKPGQEGQLNFFNLKMDLTPQKYLSMIVCEIGNIPSHSVPVVIKELSNEFEKEDEDDEESSEEEDNDDDDDDEEVEEE